LFLKKKNKTLVNNISEKYLKSALKAKRNSSKRARGSINKNYTFTNNILKQPLSDV